MTTHVLSRITRLALLGVLVTPLSAFAQDTPKTGLVLAVPAAISVIWNVTDRMALRPEFTFSTSSSSSSSGDVDSTTVGPGVSALFYMRKWEGVRTYFSPLYTYRHSSSTASSGGMSNDSSSSTHQIAGSIGAEFVAHRRFGIFGEVGIGYTHGSAEPRSSSTKPTLDAWAVRTSVGAILFF
jgi:hypothetical protein